MSAQEFDFIVIGAGHNGLIAANYLCRTGASVLLLERRLEAGGGLTTEEVTLPGYLHNLHSYFHDTIDIMPPYRDLDLEEHGAVYIKPPVQVATITPDGKALISHTDVQKSIASLTRFSAADAKAYADCHEEYREYMETIVVPALFSAPSHPSEQIAAMEETDEGLAYLRLCRQTPQQVVSELFETEIARAHVLFQLAIPRGAVFDSAGTGFFAPLIISQIEDSQICRGGSHKMAHALWKALLKGGGAIRGVREVKRLTVEKGKVTGVKLRDGEIIRARKGVVSTVDIKQTFEDFLQDEKIDTKITQASRNYQLDEFSLFSVHLALNEPPKYTAAKFDADSDKAVKVNLGFHDMAAFTEHWADIRAGRLPQVPRMYCSAPTVFDPTQAPEGKHTALAWIPVPYALKDKTSWEKIKHEFGEKCIAYWKTFAPNLDEKNIIAKKFMPPTDIDAKFSNMRQGGIFMGKVTLDQIEYFRPHPLLSQYKTPIEGLYLGGAGCHPGGGIIGGGGYIAASVIADDFELDKWWEA